MTRPERLKNQQPPRRTAEASDRVSPPVSDSTLKSVKQLMGPEAAKRAGKLPRKGWGEG